MGSHGHHVRRGVLDRRQYGVARPALAQQPAGVAPAAREVGQRFPGFDLHSVDGRRHAGGAADVLQRAGVDDVQ